MKNYILKYGILTFLWLTYTLPALAGPGDPPIDDDPVEPVPVDNWMLLLALAGTILGAYLLIKHHKKAIA